MNAGPHRTCFLNLMLLQMEDLKTNVGQLKDHVSDYAKTYIDLVKAKATKGASNAAAGATIGILSLILAFFFLQFLFFGLAWWLGSLIGNAAGGFFYCSRFIFIVNSIGSCATKKSNSAYDP